ncbi:MAG: rRNA cytosine-C5-methyltransferase [Paludibacteraceae bacterium]|nr:rRNA cytosine-C5-methyltransferase [Paludibacteraceae bacterium]
MDKERSQQVLPLEFIEDMRLQLGGEADQLFRALDGEPTTAIRLNDKVNTLTFDCDIDEVPWHLEGYYLSERPQFTLDPLFHAGAYYVQEASSMFIQQALDQYVNPNSIILDLCAAPGGKSTLISQFIDKKGLLISNEVVRQRVFILSENIQKWGNGNTIVTHNQASDFGDKCRNLFDCVLVDAPCSGEGMFRKDKASRAEWSRKNVKMCAERQRKILMDVWDALRPGGIMIYSTCTFNKEENENNVIWMAECLGANVLDLDYEQEWGIAEGHPGYHFYPHKVRGEGLYVCVLQKKEDSYAPFRVPTPKKPQQQKVEDEEELQRWLKYPQDWVFRQGDRFVTAYPAEHKELIEYLTTCLTCISLGFGISEKKKVSMVPQHSLCMSKAFRKDAFPCIDLSLDKALAYLRSEALEIEEGMPMGIVLLTYEDVPLGFVKNVGNRLNNLYPNEWRIRKL